MAGENAAGEPGGLDEAEKKLLQDILRDGVVTKEEFKKFAAAVMADGKKTAQEIETLNSLVQKAIADATTKKEKEEIIEQYKAMVPAAVFNRTMDVLTQKQIKQMRTYMIMYITSMAAFFFAFLLENLSRVIGG